jgi:hypothetical protein
MQWTIRYTDLIMSMLRSRLGMRVMVKGAGMGTSMMTRMGKARMVRARWMSMVISILL